MSSAFQQVTIFLNSGPYQLWQNKYDNSLHVGKIFDGPAGQYFALEPFWGEEKSSDASDLIDTQPMAYEEQPVVSAQELLEQQDHVLAKALAEEQDKEFAQTSAQPPTGSWANVAKAEPKAQPKVQPKAQPKAQATAQPKVQPKAQPKAQAEAQANWQETVRLYETSLISAIRQAKEDGRFRRADGVVNIFHFIPHEIRKFTFRYGEDGPEAVAFWGKRGISPPISSVKASLPSGYTITVRPFKMLVHRIELRPTI